MFDTFWEQAFARRVLARARDLTPDGIEPQARVSVPGDIYKVDFYASGSDLVIEIDGYAKSGSPVTAAELERRNRRDAALQSRGLRVLHFSNAQVQSEPNACLLLVEEATAKVGRSPLAPQKTTTPQATARDTASREPRRRRHVVPALVVVAAVAVGTLWFLGHRSDGASAAFTAGVVPTGSVCPPGYPIKGNVSDQGQRIAHSPGQQFYDTTNPERCYANLAEAATDRFRPSSR
jgi:very-short-patch-repair endonuclease